MTAVLILGGEGQVGRALAAAAHRRGIEARSAGRGDCDIADRAAVERAVGWARLVVNCAAFTAVDQAETAVAAAYGVNAVGAENVAAACADAGVPLVHLSTDYVFDGASPAPAPEDAATSPLGVYGRSKLAGELAVRARLASHIILRTSWIFSSHGENFVRTILRLARTQEELRVIDDQVGGPT